MKTYMILSGRELIRNRLAILLFFVIPSLFFILTQLTMTNPEIVFKLPAISEDTTIHVGQRTEALIFIGLAAVGVISSFLGLILSQKDILTTQRLIICGYRPSEIIVSKLFLLLAVVMIVGFYVAFLLRAFIRPVDLAGTALAFTLGGYVYGCYGLLVGTLVRHELEGILLVVLLANVDVGWLQNPIYYTDAQNKLIIRLLPAFYPSQVSMASVLTSFDTLVPYLLGTAYGTLLYVIAILISRLRLRVHRQSFRPVITHADKG